MDIKSISYMILNQEELRTKISHFMKRDAVSFSSMATDIDISPKTLNSFIVKQKDVPLKQLLKIDNWLSKKETHDRP